MILLAVSMSFVFLQTNTHPTALRTFLYGLGIAESIRGKIDSQVFDQRVARRRFDDHPVLDLRAAAQPIFPIDLHLAKPTYFAVAKISAER